VPGFAFKVELAGGDALRCALVRLSDEVFDVAGPNAPHAPAADLDPAKLPGPEQGPDLVWFTFSSSAVCEIVRKRRFLGSSVTGSSYVFGLGAPRGLRCRSSMTKRDKENVAGTYRSWTPGTAPAAGARTGSKP
jgi:hypothetical protein